MLAADYRVDLMREAGVVLMDETIFATVAGASGYISPEFLADITGHKRGFGGVRGSEQFGGSAPRPASRPDSHSCISSKPCFSSVGRAEARCRLKPAPQFMT
jgi:hypothetical protein